MDSYIADKKTIFSSQTADQFALFNRGDPLQRGFAEETRARARYFSEAALEPGLEGAFLLDHGAIIREGGKETLLPLDPLRVRGTHNRLNLLAAALACRCFGMAVNRIAPALRAFPGIEHRLELVAEVGGVRYYNDSAATIPHATAAALEALPAPVTLIAGGTDKQLDFHPLLGSIQRAARIILLAGSATEKMLSLFDQHSIPYEGPFDTLAEAVYRAADGARPGASVLFSPACASFELFLNEFDRGRRFKQVVADLAR